MSGWALGNGTLTGRYARVNKIVTFELRLTVGSTSNTAALGPIFSLPVTPFSGSIWGQGFNGMALDVSVGTQSALKGWAVLTNNFYPVATTTSGAYADTYYVSATAPFTWATGDILLMYGTYEAA